MNNDMDLTYCVLYFLYFFLGFNDYQMNGMRVNYITGFKQSHCYIVHEQIIVSILNTDIIAEIIKIQCRMALHHNSVDYIPFHHNTYVS